MAQPKPTKTNSPIPVIVPIAITPTPNAPHEDGSDSLPVIHFIILLFLFKLIKKKATEAAFSITLTRASITLQVIHIRNVGH